MRIWNQIVSQYVRFSKCWKFMCNTLCVVMMYIILHCQVARIVIGEQPGIQFMNAAAIKALPLASFPAFKTKCSSFWLFQDYTCMARWRAKFADQLFDIRLVILTSNTTHIAMCSAIISVMLRIPGYAFPPIFFCNSAEKLYMGL